MNRIRHAIARGPRTAACVAVVLCACAGAPAQASSPVEEMQAWPEVETVRTLLRADAAAALADCNVPGICRPGAERADSGERVSQREDDIRVAAIFGSTRRLTIDVLVNGALLRYRAGHGAPVAGAVSTAGYRLLAVEGACVHLRRDELNRTACLDVGRAYP
ncbi:hypothetical protein D3C85_415050 [compost metagenome]|jgi:hypothetical protein|uniref:hypothetical protein n=1 Tax=Achromobacter sp. TaxID=134375 RepID=UPI000FB6CBFF